MNNYARTLLQNKITKVLSDAKAANEIDHPGLIGQLRENFIRHLLNPLLNSNYSIGSGKITDYNGTKSNETDIIIYSKEILPPFFFHAEEKIQVFPIESVLKCIEIKSVLNKQTLESTYKKFKSLDENLVMTSGVFDEYGNPLSQIYIKIKFEIFAYTTLSKKDFKKYFLSIYKKIDPHWETNPLIGNVCVANHGWFVFSPLGWKYLSYDHEKNQNEEIIGYLCATVHGLEDAVVSRGNPRIGQYLINSSIQYLYKNTNLE